MSDSARTPTPKSSRRKGGASKKATGQASHNPPHPNLTAGVTTAQSASVVQQHNGQTSTPPPSRRKRNNTNNNRAPNHHEYASDSQTATSNPLTGSARQNNHHNSNNNRAASGYRSESNALGTARPVSNSSATPAKQAYAGPTFHASPAASALPMPKFFSKSVPSEAPMSKLQEQVEAEGEPPGDCEAPQQVQRTQSGHKVEREESPLDFLLNAHRKEQQRLTPESSQKSLRPTASNSSSATSTSRSSRPNHFRHTSGPGLSNKDIFMLEMDGASDGHETDDASGTPSFQQRLQALQASSSSADKEMDSQHLAQTEALKRLLFHKEAQQDDAMNKGPDRPRDFFAPHQQNPGQFQQPQYHSDGGYMGSAHNATPPRPYSTARPPSGNYYPATRSYEPQMATPRPDAKSQTYPYPSAPPHGVERDVKTMESDLRRLLKLDGFPSSSTS